VITQKLQKGEKITFCKDEKSFENLTVKDIAVVASKGDEIVIEIFELSGKYLGKGLSILIDILYPQLFEKAYMEIIDQEALKPAKDVCEIVPAILGDQIGDFTFNLCSYTSIYSSTSYQ
jgi:glucokinase